MKGLPLFFLKNSMGANMKKSFRNPCNGQASTSTLPTFSIDNVVDNPPRKSVTLEEMILQLEVEEELARRATFQDDDHVDNSTMIHHRRKSCVSNSDILRSARSALSQYPRFSLDGKDAMYRSSFRKIDGKEGLLGAPLLQCRRVATRRRSGTSTSALGGESAVVWCKPGVVAKLMGLEAMPVPVARRKHSHNHHHGHNTGKMGCKEEGGCNRNPRRRERRKEASSLEAAREGKAPWQPTHAFIKLEN